jgi:hypothetical protein
LSYEDNVELGRITYEVETEIQRLFTEVLSLQNEFKGQDIEDFKTRANK